MLLCIADFQPIDGALHACGARRTIPGRAIRRHTGRAIAIVAITSQKVQGLTSHFEQRLALCQQPAVSNTLRDIARGIEKETLRVTDGGRLAQTPHPRTVGSALTHPSITTDFSEALMEFITPVFTDIDGCLASLDQIHRFTLHQLAAQAQPEYLWLASMPCILPGNEGIPVAQYGSSNVAHMKTAYRIGLGHRYGRLMQTIAGIHYNFSLPDEFWCALWRAEVGSGAIIDEKCLQDFKTERYFALVRNFRRYVWLLVYLFGASPALCKSFLDGRRHKLQEFDQGSLYAPHATSLRMGDLGYQSSAQEHVVISYNNLDEYVASLLKGLTQPLPEYERIGVLVDGDYRQLSSNLLQIENEFYSTIRPKRTTKSGEAPITALCERGVEYIEVRCIDVNPYQPLGIDAEQIRFIDSFLLFCALTDSPPLCTNEYRVTQANLSAVVNRGREPGLALQKGDSKITLQAWASELVANIERCATVFDGVHGGNEYAQIAAAQRAKIADPNLTPSAQVLADMRAQKLSYVQFEDKLSQQHRDDFLARPLPENTMQEMREEAAQSLRDQAKVEAADTLTFEQYLARYYQQYDEAKVRHC
jgi:glutamate--cysteine ligase